MGELILICYDISSNKGRRKVDLLLCHYGERIQYSVFRASLKQKQLVVLKQQITSLFEQTCFNTITDSIYIFKICTSCEKKRWGIGIKEEFSRKYKII